MAIFEAVKSDRKLHALAKDAATALRVLKLPHVVLGGTGVVVWGRPYTTQDIDALVAMEPSAYFQVLTAFSAAGFILHPKKTAKDAIRVWEDGKFVRLYHRTGLHVDLAPAEYDVDRFAIQRAKLKDVFGTKLRVAAPEDVVAFKLPRFDDRDKYGIKTILVALRGAFDTVLLTRRAEALAKIHGRYVLDNYAIVRGWYKKAVARRLSI